MMDLEAGARLRHEDCQTPVREGLIVSINGSVVCTCKSAGVLAAVQLGASSVCHLSQSMTRSR